MATYKCKMCGGSFEIAEGMTVCECEYCGTSQTLPKSDSEQMLNMFNRANHFRQQCEFDKAAEIYERMTAQSDDPELFWSLVLCRYGIEYVDDPMTKKKIPTCHRTQYKSILEDADYRQALTLADTMQRSIYEQEAQYIDAVQKGILEISNKEQPFDVFICYKESDENGRRTPDSVLAQELYYGLVNEGFKVFFSRITLESKLGTEYEPYIFAALNSAKVMVVVGTKPEYFNAVWVKNEWSRYLMLMQNDRSRTLIPAYKDMDPYDLPEALSMFQAQDMSKLGFLQDLIRGIKKIAKDEPAKTVVKETVVQSAPVNSSAAPLLKRVSIFLGDRDWNSANEYCEKVLDIDPENAQAYIYKLMAKWKLSDENAMSEAYCDDYLDPSAHIDNEPDYKKAYKFGDDSVKARLEELRLSTIYNGSLRAMRTSVTDEDYREAKKGFELITDYRNSREMASECEESANEYLYENACALMEKSFTERDLDNVIRAFHKVLDYKDSADMIDKCNEKIKEYLYRQACHALRAADSKDDYVSAARKFSSERLKNYMDSDKQAAEANKLADLQGIYENARNISAHHTATKQNEAAELFESISDFKDSAEKAEECRRKAAGYIAKEKAAKRAKVLAVSGVLGALFLVVLVTVIIPAVKYNNGLKAIESGEYDKAVVIFQELGNYKDSVDQITVAQNSKAYDSAVELLNAGKYEKAISAFNSLGDFSDSTSLVAKATELKNQRDYDAAVELLNSGKYEEAISAFNSLGDFSDSTSLVAKATELKNQRDYDAAVELLNSGKYEEAISAFKNLNGFGDSNKQISAARAESIKASSVGDIVRFGDYTWIVLEKTDNSALIFAEDTLFNKPYNDKWTSVTWEECTLREYLNGEFYYSFSNEERAMIQRVTNKNPDNAKHGTKGGNDTRDKIYLLSIDEAKTLSSGIREASERWWLRSPGSDDDDAAYVSGENGGVFAYGNFVDRKYGVRPALNLKL